MASRRKLKKCVYYVATSLIQEAIVLNSLVKEFSNTKMDSIINEVVLAYREIMMKINNPEGTNNPKEIKKYYNTIIEQFQSEVDRIIKELE
ncbi:MAG: hypothetical protein KIG42_04135 [Paludibacteraceae bacterium]|mgnify:FL=1|nr:hypothetical protein [Paludibacteraceae bacterium]